MNLCQMIFTILNFPKRIYRRFIIIPLNRKMLGECGKNVSFGKNVTITWENCFIEDSVYIGQDCLFMCNNAPIFIGSHVIFGPRVSIITGNHKYDIVGKFISEITETEKTEDCDAPVLIEEDCWIGANSVILKGVTIGKGSIVASGAIVTKDIEPYSIVGGNPAKLIKKRFNKDEIKAHEDTLYS